MTIRRELIDELFKEYETSQDILGKGGLLKELTKAVIERVSRKQNWTAIWATPNMLARGTLRGMLKGEQGHIEIEVPRDRQGSGLTATGEKGPNSFGRFR